MSQLPFRLEADAVDLYGEIRAVLSQARSSVAQSVNVAMVHAYWNIGGLIEGHVNAARGPKPTERDS